MTNLLQALPRPTHPTVEDDQPAPEQETASSSNHEALTNPPIQIPVYGARKGWKPRLPDHFGDGGAYPECHIAQYPLEMGRKKHTSIGNTLALTVDGEGKIDYTKIAKQGHRDGRHVQAQFKDLVPLAHRADLDESAREMERPSNEEVQSTTERTRLALEKLTNTRIKAAQPKHVPETGGNVSFVRYTPNGEEGKQRIIKMVETVEDPLEPPRFKHKKIPRGPPSPPAPILRSPPRKITSEDQKAWMIPPCISNWKNNKGYTIPLDKRLAADGRGLQDTHINDRFAQLSESLYVADRLAREEVRQRSLLKQRLAQKEKEQKEENLRLLAQRAREERSGISRVVAGVSNGNNMSAALAGYGSDTDSAGRSGSERGGRRSEKAAESDEEDDDRGSEDLDEEAARARDELRKERRKEREREMRMNNMGNEKRAQHFARTQNRDIGEKIALGLAKPTISKESMIDSRLFNQEKLNGSFGDEDSYNLYDRPLFSGSSAAAAIYKRGGAAADDEPPANTDERYGGGTEEGISHAMRNDRFGLGVAGKGFEGAELQESRDGPVQFERDTTLMASDPFAIDAFLDEAKKGVKRGLEPSAGSSKTRDEDTQDSKKRRG
ncbi:mRNA splicing protein [Puccinia graminis f. sp. tritici]|uniref:Pre-mRNA-processing protein 45 n=1 Tax=Puccinia graminis f. sp. tritici TaxID=56615 RepID=A0A5B0Q2R2_PUCGR|nr:mRNA splicing protein [Puccinia graminis f. sp. tritici]